MFWASCFSYGLTSSLFKYQVSFLFSDFLPYLFIVFFLFLQVSLWVFGEYVVAVEFPIFMTLILVFSLYFYDVL